MTYENFISFIDNPEKITEDDISGIKELCQKYPYFDIAKMLYLKGLHNTNSIYCESNLNTVSLYMRNRRNLYYFIHSNENYTAQKHIRADRTGSYFDMLGSVEKNSKNSAQSLTKLAERLKAARESLNSNADSTEK